MYTHTPIQVHIDGRSMGVRGRHAQRVTQEHVLYIYIYMYIYIYIYTYIHT